MRGCQALRTASESCAIEVHSASWTQRGCVDADPAGPVSGRVSSCVAARYPPTTRMSKSAMMKAINAARRDRFMGMDVSQCAKTALDQVTSVATAARMSTIR